MQLKTLLGLFCTIAILFVELNDSAPTKSSTTKSSTAKSSTTKRSTTIKPSSGKVKKVTSKPLVVGGHTTWETKIKPKHLKIFADHKKIILKKLQETHKVPGTFDPKPEKYSSQIVGGVNYLYLVKLPINKYAFVSIHHRSWIKGHYGKEENVEVRPQAYELNDKTF